MAACTAAVAGEWSGCVWVTSRWVTSWPSMAAFTAATWSASSGPASTTATRPPSGGPRMNVPVPWYVNRDGLRATTRRTSGETCSTAPYGGSSSVRNPIATP